MARKWQVLVVVSVGVFMSSLDLFIVNIAFPDIRAEFPGTSVAGLSWVLNAYAIVYAALLVPAGRLADRFGRKRFFIAGLALFLLGSLLCGLAPSAPGLIAARVVQAAGGAVITPTALGLLLPEFPIAERSVAVATWAAIGGVAAAAGPPLGGLLVSASWRWIFFVNLPIGLLAAALAQRILRESRDERAVGLPDLPGTAALTAGVAALSLGFVKANDWGWGSARTVGCLAFALAALAWFVRRCARHPLPVVDLAMLRIRSYALANLTSVCFFAGFAALLLGTVLFMTAIWHESELTAGLHLTPGPAMAALVAVPAGRLSERIGHRYVAFAGSLIAGVGVVWWRLKLGVAPDYAHDMLPGLIVNGAGAGMVIPATAGAAAASLPPERFATGSAVVTMSRQIGTVLGVALLIAAFGALDPRDPLAAYRRGMTFMLACEIASALAALAIGRVFAHAYDPAARAAPG